MSNRLGHTGRTPICPQCRYNLVATLDHGLRRCPECGYEFESHEIVRQQAPHDWTIWKGLRSASIVLTLRGTLALMVCVIGLFLCDWLLAFLITSVGGVPALLSLFILLAGLVLAGFVFGKFLSHDLSEHVGIEGIIPAMLALAFCWATLVAGTVGVDRLVTFEEINIGPILFVTGGTATITIVRYTVLAEF